MSLLQHPPRTTADPTPAAGPPEPRAAPRWQGFVLAVGVLVAAAWALAPLTIRLDGPVQARLDPDAALLVPGFGGPQGTVALRYDYGETVAIEVTVRNRSPLPLTVDEVRLVEPTYPLLAPVSGLAEPVTLAPWGSTEVTLRFEYANCRYYHERANNTYEQVQVTGRTLGRDVVSTLDLAVPLVVHSQVILHCPERTYVRGDDRRT